MFFLIFCATGELYVSTNDAYVPNGKSVVRVIPVGSLTPKTHQITTIGGTTGAYTASAYAGSGYQNGRIGAQVI